MRRVSLLLLLGVFLAFSGIASAARPHFVGTPTCVVANNQLCCSGKVAGLGTAPTVVAIDTQFQCTNRGGNNPPGHASGQSAPITPRGGQITFTNVCTNPAGCPDDMTPTFGPMVTINLFQNGNLVFSATIPIS